MIVNQEPGEEEMSITEKTIGELKEYRFFVPAYQRGYRWTGHEVRALLNDVEEFSPEGGKRYCIQPLIVKRREDGAFEVVDGQQRLTTIYIFMKIAEKITANVPFTLEYETRKGSQNFLAELPPRGEVSNANIDYYHITTAREVINAWLDKRDRFIGISGIYKKLISSVFFIWNEISDERKAISMFTKVNMGKIPLTNAELIKALLLNRDNFSVDDFKKRQYEISIAWDRIEQGLRDNSFWYFLNELNEEEQGGTRIDMLFELLADEYNRELSEPLEDEDQNYFPFSVFLTALNSEKESDRGNFVEKLWSDVEKLYAEFRDYYFDLNKYHIIGYLVASRLGVADIRALTRGKRKSEVMEVLLDKAKKTISPTSSIADDLQRLTYSISTHRSRIRMMLLLFNIATLVCKSEKQFRFPFDIYKREKWDIEHIHASTVKVDEEDGSISDEVDHSIGNLTLVDAATNRSYKNAPFLEKRKILLGRESKGLFVPLCTKNIFLKVYSQDARKMDQWNDDDKQGYTEAIEQTLMSFFDGEFSK